MNQGTKIALSLGGNIGDVSSTFNEALKRLEEEGLFDIRRSSIYRTPPVGCVSDTPDFLNMALTGIWHQTPKELLRICKGIEVTCGRPEKHLPYASRTLDMDIVLFGDMITSSSSLKIPHPELKKRFFVLIPLTEIAPDWKYPGSEYILNELLEDLKKSFPCDFKEIKKEVNYE